MRAATEAASPPSDLGIPELEGKRRGHSIYPPAELYAGPRPPGELYGNETMPAQTVVPDLIELDGEGWRVQQPPWRAEESGVGRQGY